MYLLIKIPCLQKTNNNQLFDKKLSFLDCINLLVKLLVLVELSSFDSSVTFLTK